MRILHILDHSLPHHSGYVFRTLSILREQRARGWETLHLTTPRHSASNANNVNNVGTDVIDGWTFFRTPFAAGWLSRIPAVGRYFDEMRATARRLAQVVEREKPDVLHAHSPVLNALPALWVGRRFNIPVVYEVRAAWEDAAVDHGSTTEGSLRYRLTRALETYALKRVDAITTICEGLRQDIAARNIDAGRITVIPNAVDVGGFQFATPSDEALRAELGLQGASVIGFVGSFYAYEGLDLLLSAAAQLMKQRTDLRVLLVGGGPQEQALKAQAAQLGIADRVIFSGRVPHAQVQRYYTLIDVLAYPRHRMRLTEIVTPLKPLEAMAQGRMFVASDVGGHRELIRDGETGFLFPAGDANALAQTIDKVLQQRSAWPQLAAQARVFVETERNWARSVARYVDVYGRLVSSRDRLSPAA